MTTQPHKTFADRLKSLREQRALSSYALAKLTGLTKQSLSQLERGESQPSWQTVQLLAGALGVDCREFADPTVKPPPTVEAKPRGRPRKALADAVETAVDTPQTKRGPVKKGDKAKGK